MDDMLLLNETTSRNMTSFSVSGNVTAMDQYANASEETDVISETAAYWMTLTGVIVGSIVTLLGTIGNGATIEAYRRNRKLQTTFNHLITNLCVIDLIYSAVVMPLVLAMVGSGKQILPDHLCTALGFAYYCSISASVVNLVFIAINRYVGIVHSAQYRKIFSKDCIKWWLVAVWLSTPLLYMPFLIFDSFEWRESSLRCALSSNKMTSHALKYYHIAVNVLLQILPAIALVVLYRAILRKVKRCRKSVEHHPTIFSATPTGGDANESSKAAGGRRPSVSRATSPMRPSVDVHNNNSLQILSDKKSTMSYLQVPNGVCAAVQPASSTVREKRRSFSFRRRNVSSPDLTSSDEEAGHKGRREWPSWRRRSWGDKPDAKSGAGMLMAMRPRSSTALTEAVIIQGTMLSTIDSEPTSRTLDQSEQPETVTTTTNENTTSVECLSTPSAQLLEKPTCHVDEPGSPIGSSQKMRPPALNVDLKLSYRKIMKEDANLKPQTARNGESAVSTLRLLDSAAQRAELPGFKTPINNIGTNGSATNSVDCSTQSNSNRKAATKGEITARKRLAETKLNTLPKKNQLTRCHHKLCKSHDSLYVPNLGLDLKLSQQRLRTKSVPVSRRLQRPLSRTPSIGGLNDSEAPIKEDERNTSKSTRSRRLRDKRSFTDPWKRTWSSLSSVGRGKRFRKRARSEGVAKFPGAIFSPSTPKIVIDHATSDDTRLSNDHVENTSTSSMIEDYMKRSQMEESSDSVDNKDCKWCKNLITKLLQRKTSQDSSQHQDESSNSSKRKSPRSVGKAQVDESVNTLRKDSFTAIAGVYSGEFASDEPAWSVGSRVYRYSIGGGDECASRIDSVSCAGYEYTTTRNHLQRDASKDLGASLQQQKRKPVRRHLSIYKSWRRKSFLTSSLHSSLSTDSRRRLRRRDAERHLAYSGMIICAAFALCVLPTSVISVLGGLLRVQVTPTVKFAAGMLSWLHAVVNPMLYGFLNPKYRLEFRRMAHDARYFCRAWCLCCCRGARDRSASHGSQASIASGLRHSWNPSSWFDSTRRPSNAPHPL